MPLTKKEIKYYKPLIIQKLESMSVKDELGYTQTGTFRNAPQLVPTPDGKYKVETKRVPNYRAANLQRSLTKKLLKLSVSEVERFLATELPPNEPSKESEEILIENENGEGPTDEN